MRRYHITIPVASMDGVQRADVGDERARPVDRRTAREDDLSWCVYLGMVCATFLTVFGRNSFVSHLF